jgi:dephospho-CoA kinase
MPEFGLTGGIGSGKSTVADGLVARGATLVDSDAIVRELQEPGGSVFAAMVEHFGERIVASDGTLDRAAVASIVFNDPEELTALNMMVHPPVVDEMMARRTAFLAAGDVVVVDIPLMITPDGETRPEYTTFDGKIVVDCEPDVAVARLVEFRGFDEADARARIAAQAGREIRNSIADRIIDNSGALGDLEPQLDECWAWMLSHSASSRP